MRKSILFFCLLFIIFFACQRSQKQDQPIMLAQPEFETDLKAALQAQDTLKVVDLVKNNRYRLSAVFETTGNSYFQNIIDGDGHKADLRQTELAWLANLFQGYFNDDYFIKRFQQFQGWSSAQKAEKLTADSLKEQAYQFYEQKDYKASETLNQQALLIYLKLGDRTNQALVLNGLGLCCLNRRQFDEALNYLTQALDLNRQLGLKQNIVVNLNGIANVYQRQRKFAEALDYFQQSLELAREIGDEVSAGFRLSNIGDTYHRMDDQQKAKQYLEQALEVAKQHEDNELKRTVFLNLGAVQADLSEFSLAIEYWEQGLIIAEEIDHHESQGSFLSNLGMAYRNTGKYDEALATLRKALTLNIDTKNRWTEGNTLREMGVNLYLKGDPDSALIYWNRSLSVFEELADTSSMGLLTGYMGIFHKNTGQPHQAIGYFNRALELSRKIGNDREASNIMTNMGNVYNDVLADYEKAAQLFRQALEIKQRLGETHFAGVILGNLGLCYKNQGDYQNALEHFFKSLKIARDTKNKSSEGVMLSHIGDIYQDVGLNKEANDNYYQAFSIFHTTKEIKPQIELLINLGSNYLNLEQADSAITSYQKALQMAKKIDHKNFEATCYYYLGNAYKELGESKKALAYFDQAQQLIQQTKVVNLQAKLFNGQGEVDFTNASYQNAFHNFENGAKIGEKIYSPEIIWRAYYGMGRAKEKLAQWDKAEKYYQQAIESIEAMRANIRAMTLKETFLNDKIEVYQAMVRTLLKMGREEDAYHYLERSKARTFLDILSTSHFNFAQGIDSLLLHRKKDLELRIYQTQEALVQLYTSSPQHEPTEQQIATADSLEKLKGEQRRVLNEIEVKYPRYSDLLGAQQPLTLRQVQQKVVKPETALIEYLVGEETTWVWVIENNSSTVIDLNIKRSHLEALVLQLLKPFRDARSGKIKNLADIHYDIQVSNELYQSIFKPLESCLGTLQRLIIIPDDVLCYVPFEALVTEIETVQALDKNVLFSRYQKLNYLIERFIISYAHSASVLEPGLHKTKMDKDKPSLLAFGNPDFGGSEKIVSQFNLDQIQTGITSSMRSHDGLIFAPLPQSEVEIKSIAEIIAPSVYFLNQDAKEGTFKQMAADYPIIHLATHCITEEQQPMFSRIIFAQDNDPAEDGFLHTHEVFNLKLQADLVTLSACETGLGKLSRGEGLIGLTRAFMYAGTPSVLVSLWSVSETTAELMKYFYSNLSAGMSKAEALQQAKIKLLKSESQFGDDVRFSFANPFFWAPFILFGTIEPMCR